MLEIILIFAYCLRFISSNESNTTGEDSYDYLLGKGRFTKSNIGSFIFFLQNIKINLILSEIPSD